jgi:hypothetical protein
MRDAAVNSRSPDTPTRPCGRYIMPGVRAARKRPCLQADCNLSFKFTRAMHERLLFQRLRCSGARRFAHRRILLAHKNLRMAVPLRSSDTIAEWMPSPPAAVSSSASGGCSSWRRCSRFCAAASASRSRSFERQSRLRSRESCRSRSFAPRPVVPEVDGPGCVRREG